MQYPSEIVNRHALDLSCGPVVKNPPASAGDTGPIPGLGRSCMLWGHEARVPQLRSPHATAAAAGAP